MEYEITLEEYLWIELVSSWDQTIMEYFYQDAE
jgi:hypothetical protein